MNVLGVVLRINFLMLLAMGVAVSISAVLILALCCARCSKGKKKNAAKKSVSSPPMERRVSPYNVRSSRIPWCRWPKA